MNANKFSRIDDIVFDGLKTHEFGVSLSFQDHFGHMRVTLHDRGGDFGIILSIRRWLWVTMG